MDDSIILGGRIKHIIVDLMYDVLAGKEYLFVVTFNVNFISIEMYIDFPFFLMEIGFVK